jgi:hypothetical protein
MATKTKDVTDPNEAMAKLGIQNPETPGGETLVETAVSPNEQEPKVEKPNVPDTSEQQKLELEGEQKVSSTQDEEGNLTEEEKQRRTWQAEADMAKAEKKRMEEELQAQKELNKQIQGALTPFLMKYGQQPPQGVNQPKEEDIKADYIEDGMFDPGKHQVFLEKTIAKAVREAKTDITQDWEKRQEQKTAQEQLNEVVKEFPEYVNPLTGQPDIERLQRDLQSYTGGKSMLDLVREYKGKSVAQSAVSNPLATEASISAMEKNANRPQSVASTVETTPEKKEVPENLKKAVSKGLVNTEDLPFDFDGLKE